MRKIVPLLALVALVAIAAVPASAASPLSAMPVGTSVKYQVATQSSSPDGGQQSSSHVVAFTRTAPAAIAVSIDGAPQGTITLSAGGSPSIPPNLKTALAPFGEIAAYMKGAPQPLAPNASWAANLPVPVNGQTDNVPVVLTVTQMGPGGATVSGSGGNSTEVQPHLRDFPATVSVNATIRFTAAKTIASATRTVTIDVKMGRRDRRSKSFGSSWTMTPVP